MARTKKAAAPDPAAVRAATQRFKRGLQGLPENYLFCRDLRHNWNVAQDFHIVPFTHEGAAVSAMRRLLTCGRCPAAREQLFLSTRYGLGEKVADRTTRPPDYRIPGIPRGVPVQRIIQQEAYRRAVAAAAGASRADRATAER